MNKPIEESLDIIAESLKLQVEQKKQELEILERIADRVSWISGER